MITTMKEGTRVYFAGDTFAAKSEIKSLGAHWDAERKQWWIGATKEQDALALETRINTTARAQQAALPPASGAMVEVPGNTYPARDKLRAMGGAWDGAAKVWRVPASRLEVAKAAVASAPRDSGPRYTSCKQCGARPGPRGWPRIYRNGICSNCYRDAQDEDY